MYTYEPPHMAEQKQDEQLGTYIQQLCEDTGCSPRHLPEPMNDRECDERVSGISVLAARHDEEDDTLASNHYLNRFG